MLINIFYWDLPLTTDKAYWSKVVSKMIRAELAKRDMSYQDLIDKLRGLDVQINVDDLRARVSRGNFSATLFVQCLKAMGVKTLLFEDSFFESKKDETISDN